MLSAAFLCPVEILRSAQNDAGPCCHPEHSEGSQSRWHNYARVALQLGNRTAYVFLGPRLLLGSLAASSAAGKRLSPRGVTSPRVLGVISPVSS